MNVLSDLELLKRQIFSYRTMYLLCAGYTVSLTLIVTYSTRYFLKSIGYERWGSVSTFLLFTWIMKPAFGFLADWVYLGRFRFKGYFALLSFVNFLLMCGCLWIVPHVQNQKIEPIWLIIMICMASTNLAIIDSISLGMTSIVRNLENRLISMEASRTDGSLTINSSAVSYSFITNYLTYMSVRYSVRPFYNLLGYTLHESYQADNLYLKIDYSIIAVLSLYLMVHSLCFFRELKQSSTFRVGVGLKDHFKQFTGTLGKDGTYWLVFFGALALLFPFEDIELAEILDIKRPHLETVNYFSWFGGALLVVTVALTLVYKKVRSLQSPHYYILGVYSSQLITTLGIMLAFFLVSNLWLDYVLLAFVGYSGYIYVIVVCSVCIQSVVKHTKEGYEVFSLNMISALMNLCSLGSGLYYYDGMRSYMKDNDFSDRSVMYTCAIALGYALVTGALAAFLLITKYKPMLPRSRTESTDRISF